MDDHVVEAVAYTDRDSPIEEALMKAAMRDSLSPGRMPEPPRWGRHRLLVDTHRTSRQ